MGFSPTKAAIRFGEGLSPDLPPPQSIEDILGQLASRDTVADLHPVPVFSALLPDFAAVTNARRAARRGRDTDDAEALDDAYRDARRTLVRSQISDAKQMFARSIITEAPFRERLVRFWGDHFTVVGTNAMMRNAVPHYLEEAIRPHVAGRFADMLKAVVTHPMMLLYLDQSSSFGPNSPAARGRRGLNENFARELLELHILGVGHSYAQADVHEMAKLLTGLTANAAQGFSFRPNRAEPGAEIILGRSYGGESANLADIFEALENLALHPTTANHLARKLAVHFTSDTPDPAMVDAMAGAYRDADGALMPMYNAMLNHRFSWESFGQKVKQPIDFVTSAFRALSLPTRSVERLKLNKLRSYVAGPLSAMGQPLFQPDGPDGWPEAAEDWITPQGLAARLQWSMAAPSAFYRGLPDPRGFAESALADLADDRVRFVARSAETRREGIGLILSSPAFQRR
ncbi:MAG: DUF1800 domain-containing protein [Pseudomonadota bacterium]